MLEFAADAHGVSTAGLALAIVQTVLAEGLLDSLLDDREAVASDDVRPMRRRRRRGARTASASIAATSFSMARADGCLYRKSDSAIMVMKAAEDGRRYTMQPTCWIAR